ncbi:MAG: glutamine synthetase family protein [Granulosicoccaceae bacterium]
MAANLTFDALKQAVSDGSIDTVLVCLVDMQGRLLGKRFHAQNFVEHSWQETHCCNYLLATDIEMATPDGYASTSWESGYGDYVMKPDMATLRSVPWLEGTAMVLCDVLDHHHHQDIPHSPRAILKNQIAKLAEHGWIANMATELEFFLFEGRYNKNAKSHYKKLQPISDYNEDYHILQTSKEEGVMRPLRNHLVAAGVPVENSKGEAETGQEELNIRYGEALECADNHTIAKHAAKEIAWQQGYSASFIAKWHKDKVGSASHVHQSLWTKDGSSVFHDKSGEHGMSDTMKYYVAGLIKYAPDYTYFLAPYINSYKRFAKGTFAPTKIAWSVDNRTAGFRLCGDGAALRVECRIGGSDLNPYLAQASQIAAGLAGVEQKLELPAETVGNIYANDDCPNIPSNLRDATASLAGSNMLRAAFGDDVIDHYSRAAQVEQEEYDLVVTDYEIARGFERA